MNALCAAMLLIWRRTSLILNGYMTKILTGMSAAYVGQEKMKELMLSTTHATRLAIFVVM